jgi:hypothetical protein
MRIALWTCTLAALPALVRAQAPAASEPAASEPGPSAPAAKDASLPYRAGERVLGVWLAASFSPSAVFGRITDRRVVLTGLRLEHVIESAGSVTTTYTLDVHPIAVVTNTPRYAMQWVRAQNGARVRLLVETSRAPAVGVGASPLGLQFYSAPRGGTRIFAGGSAGGIWFNRDMPVAYARRFNFTLQLGTGVELAARSGGALVVGYKFHHLSNAGTARANPGMDGHLVYVGVMRRRAGRSATVATARSE